MNDVLVFSCPQLSVVCSFLLFLLRRHNGNQNKREDEHMISSFEMRLQTDRDIEISGYPGYELVLDTEK
jgi:hypothetical protein